jgi:hypothetical protein
VSVAPCLLVEVYMGAAAESCRVRPPDGMRPHHLRRPGSDDRDRLARSIGIRIVKWFTV